MKLTITYRVRPVTRWQVTRHYIESGKNGEAGGCESKGEFDQKQQAVDAMVALVHFETTPSAGGYPPKFDGVEIPEISWTDNLPDTPYPKSPEELVRRQIV